MATKKQGLQKNVYAIFGDTSLPPDFLGIPPELDERERKDKPEADEKSPPPKKATAKKSPPTKVAKSSEKTAKPSRRPISHAVGPAA